MDIVYVVAAAPMSGSATGELRYSLRSLVNLPHDRVIIAGWKPDWIRNVTYVSTVQSKGRWENAFRNLKAALPHVSDDFVLMNDDFFIMRPVDEMPVFHGVAWSPTVRARNTEYQRAKLSVWHICTEEGIADPVSYELHVPLPMNRHLLERSLARANGFRVAGYQRSLYGNLNRIGGSHMDDVKVISNRADMDKPFLSTNEASFKGGKVGELIRDTFPEPSPYES